MNEVRRKPPQIIDAEFEVVGAAPTEASQPPLWERLLSTAFGIGMMFVGALFTRTLYHWLYPLLGPLFGG